MKDIVVKTKEKLKRIKIGRRAAAAAIAALIILGTLGAAYATYIIGEAPEKTPEAKTQNNAPAAREETIAYEPERPEKAPPQRSAMPKALSEEEIKKQQEAEIEEAINSVALPEAFEAEIAKRDGSERILKNAKTMIAAKTLDENQQETLEAYITANEDATAVFALYDYLFDNYFTQKDMEEAIERHSGGENLSDILEDYANADESYKAHNYPEGMLEYLLDKKGATIEQLYAAEIISHRGLMELDTIIGRITEGESMAEICAKLGIINTGCKKASVTVSSAEIMDC
ncbi:MAG: hypothetical protein FWG11_07300, partial [Promicromonosporaceae bacterium]|nr:hypothetical protein [Promicromonosporaceae bacterium]